MLTKVGAALASPETAVMLTRAGQCDKALRQCSMETSGDDRWTLGLDMFGYRTHYIVESDGIVRVRIEGSQENLPLFEQLAVIHQLQLYSQWVPFCDKSDLLHEISSTNMLAFINIWTPLGTVLLYYCTTVHVNEILLCIMCILLCISCQAISILLVSC
jgi:hypothetical protein